MPDGPRAGRVHRPRTAAAVVLAVAAAVVAAAVTGCGGGNGEGSTSTSASVSTTTTAPTQIAPAKSTTTRTGPTVTTKEVNHPATPTAAVKQLLLSSTPRTDCSSDVVTDHYLRVAYGGRGACLKAVTANNKAKSLGSVESNVMGDKATVTVHPVSGIYDGEKITVSLVRTDGGWQVDGIKSNAPVGP